MHALIVARASRIRDKEAAVPAMAFPTICRDGGVCACEASAGGRVSRVGARFTQERTAQLPEDTARSVTPILPVAAHICVQESRPYTVRDPVAVWGRDLRIGSPRMGRGRTAMNRATPKRSGVTPRRAGACSA